MITALQSFFHRAIFARNAVSLQSGRGEVYSFSTVFNAPEGFEAYTPYTVALIKLEEGPMLTAQLTDVTPSEVEIGMPVEMVTRRLRVHNDEGVIIYGYKFRPVSL